MAVRKSHSQSIPDTVTIPVRGMKRKLTLDHHADIKKVPRLENPLDSDSDGSNYASSEVSSSAEENRTPQSDTQTPSTPLSSRPSPRWPSDLKNHACPYVGCEKTFNRPAKLGQHLRSHTNDRLFVCPHLPCTKDFLRDTHLKHHIKSAHSDVRDYVCEWEGCGKSFITSTRLKRHHAAHEGRQKFICTECAQSFRKHGTLQAHVSTVHNGKKRFTCALRDDEGKECGKGFDAVGKLKTHEGRVHGGKRFSCSICNTQPQGEQSGPDHVVQELAFSTYAALQGHIKIEHPPTCAECGLQCTTQATLKSHVEVQHGILEVDERRTLTCSEPGCGRAFTRKGNLNTHFRMVHEGRSFVCGGIDLSTLKHIADWNGHNACGQALSTKANLAEHIRTAHMGLDHSRKRKTNLNAGSSQGRSSRRKEVSAFTRLTGSGYREETGRNIPCVLSDCNFHFLREYDLEIHLESGHGLPYHEVQELMLEQKNSTSLPTFEGPSVFATADDLEAEIALDAHFEAGLGFGDTDNALEVGTRRRDFWLGGHPLKPADTEDDWLRDEMEMDQLIEGDHDRGYGEDSDGQDIAMLDPALR